MAAPIISVRNVSKRYVLGETLAHDTLRDHLMHGAKKFKSLFKNGGSDAQPASEQTEIWALNDVSFDIKEGEVVGIIGRNGMGKSTLLKVLSQITEPTRGEIHIRGRIASLLEVGTGFHPELTGRENIFLNGAILGMSQTEIRRKFDEIVAFSEVEKFLDTPVKRYSSGMYMRLAFAVAAHLEPEILLVDEVLAVGDAAFQKKCLSKMEDIGGTGRTVLFVSHNISAVTRICSRAIWLHKGQIGQDGPSAKVASAYLSSGVVSTAHRQWPDGNNPGNKTVKLLDVRVRTEDGETAESIDIRQPVGVDITYEVLTAGKVLVPNYHFYNEEGVCIFISVATDEEWRQKPRPRGVYKSTAWVPGNYLAEGKITIGTAISTFQPFEVHFYERDAVAFTIVDAQTGDTARGDYAGQLPGIVRPLLRWETQVIKPSA